MPTVRKLLETSLYVDDLDRSQHFYEQNFGFQLMLADERMRALSIHGGSVLLLFRKGASIRNTPVPGGMIPPHDASGRAHLAFSIAADDLGAWRQRLSEQHIQLESTVNAPRGGVSLYFRDPDGHLLELATPGIWPIE